MAADLTLEVEATVADRIVNGFKIGDLNLPVGPISTLVPTKYHRYVSKGILKSLLAEDEISGSKIRDMIGAADIPVIVQKQTFSVYPHIMKHLTTLGKQAVEEINPWIVNVLVDWSRFDNFICQLPLLDTEETVSYDNDDDMTDDDGGDTLCASSSQTSTQVLEKNLPIVAEQNFKWSLASTKCLIGKYKEYERKFRTSVKKSAVWKQIAGDMRKEGYLVEWSMVEKKWRNLKQHYKYVVDSNKKTGNSRKTWEYFEAMQEILRTDPAVQPPKTISSMKVCSELPHAQETTPLKKVKEKKGRTPPSWIIEYMAEQQEYERERLDEIKKMHNEQMKILKENNDLLKTLTHSILNTNKS